MGRLKAVVLLCEAGVIVLNEARDVVSARRFQSTSNLEAFRQIEGGRMIPDFEGAVREALGRGFDEFAVAENLVKVVSDAGFKAVALDDETLGELQAQKINLMVKAGLVGSEDEAEGLVRDFAVALSEARLRELAAKPDLQAMEAVQALDEVDRAVNVLSARVREWYGLHYPELFSLIDDATTYAKIVCEYGRRENVKVEGLKSLGLSEKKAEAVIIAAEKSKGGEVRDEDLRRITSLAQEILHLSTIREKMAEHVERTMAEIAPNITAVAGATIGARLIAKAGGLERMARMPASTIQVLGAEKALFRALRTGTRPPKHGVIFQHQAVHSAPKWQRGKIARSLAAKIAIATRIDAFRGGKEEGLEEKFKKRLEEIRVKYGEPPRLEKVRGAKQRERKERRARGRKRPYKG